MRKAADDAIKAKTAAWVDEVSEAALNGAFYGALKAHDIIIQAIDYAYNSSGQPEQAMWAHSIAGVFTGQGAVCEGYAKCFEYLLDLAGIPNIYILGTGAKEAHAWNAVEIENRWFLCDITWDDPDSSVSEGLNDSNYSYFCIPESKFNLKHKAWGDKNYYGYELPEFDDTMEQSFFTVFECYSDEAFSETTGESFALSMTEYRYRDIDYVFAAFPADAKDSFLRYVVPHLPDIDADILMFRECLDERRRRRARFVVCAAGLAVGEREVLKAGEFVREGEDVGRGRRRLRADDDALCRCTLSNDLDWLGNRSGQEALL